MRKITLSFVLALFVHTTYSQGLAQKIAIKTCDCLPDVISVDSLSEKIKQCTTNSMAIYLETGSDDEKKLLSNVEDIQNLFMDVYKYLKINCYKIRAAIIKTQESRFYILSNSRKANSHYSNGVIYMKEKSYNKAIEEFEKAYTIDTSFVMSIDNLAICYKSVNDLSKAISFYKKSLQIFPQGKIALLNLSSAYFIVEDYDNSLTSYKEYVYNFPNDAEGYFGLAKIYLLKGDFEQALENIFTAHQIYFNTKNEYIKDTDNFISIIYSKMKDLERLEDFNRIASKYNIEIN